MTYYMQSGQRIAATRRPSAVAVRVTSPASFRLPARASGVARLRVANGDELGVLPALAVAAIPSVKTLASRALTSVLGIVDPGKRRTANRKARAQMWGDLARAGSITAARRVLGGQTMQYTVEEKGFYVTQWNQLRAVDPTLAAEAQRLGPLGIPDPGSDQVPAQLSPEDESAIQREIDFYHSPKIAAQVQQVNADGSPVPTPPTPKPPALAGANAFLALGLLGAFLATRRR